MENPTSDQRALLTAAARTTDPHLLARELGRARRDVITDFDELTRLGLCARTGKHQYRVLLTADAVLGTATFRLQRGRIVAAARHAAGEQPTGLSVDVGRLPYGTDPASVVQALNSLNAAALAYPTRTRQGLTWGLSVLGGVRREVDALLSPD